MTHDVTLPAAALAGLLSFLSPCVLPLVPSYLTFIAGTTIEKVAAQGEARARRGILFAAVLFIFGFSTVFVGLGATASVFGQMLHEYFLTLSLLAGVAIIVMGLHFLGVFRFALLYREARVKVQKPAGIWSAYIMGLAFGFGWTPCIGPILAAIRGRRVRGDSRQRHRAAGLLFGRAWPAIFVGGTGNRTLCPRYQALPSLFWRDRAGYWRPSRGNGNSLFDWIDLGFFGLVVAELSRPRQFGIAAFPGCLVNPSHPGRALHRVPLEPREDSRGILV